MMKYCAVFSYMIFIESKLSVIIDKEQELYTDDFLRKLRKLCTDVGLRSKQNIPLLTPSPLRHA